MSFITPCWRSIELEYWMYTWYNNTQQYTKHATQSLNGLTKELKPNSHLSLFAGADKRLWSINETRKYVHFSKAM